MGAACSAGVMGGRISSEEYSGEQKMEFKQSKLKNVSKFGKSKKENKLKSSGEQAPSPARSESIGSRFSFSMDFNPSSPRLSGDNKVCFLSISSLFFLLWKLSD